MHKKLVIGNWKMNTTVQEADSLVDDILSGLQTILTPIATTVLCPPFTHLERVAHRIANTSALTVGAQNCSEHSAGAYTGEVSAAMLKSLGISHVIIGHSERRQYFGESSSLMARKVDAALKAGLTPVYCCGEPQTVRDAGGQQDFVNTQLEESLFHLDEQMAARLVVAYEPIWAIGTGQTADPLQIRDMHSSMRHCLARRFSQHTANAIPLLYGGSVTAATAKEIVSCPNVDGGLVGGSSLHAKDFIAIIQAVNK